VLENYRDILSTRLVHDERSTKTRFLVITIVLVLILANLFYLNFNSIPNNRQEDLATEDSTSTTTITPLNEASTTTITTQPSVPTTTAPATSAVRDYFIPLGSGTGQGTEWKDVPGAQATVDFSQYSPIKEIRLEASVNVPTGNESVSVRLYNVTDKHPVWYSEITSSGNSNSYLTSSPIIFDLGQKLYQVQIKTELNYPANLTQSRIHVISK
jgi:hypothetical protein